MEKDIKEETTKAYEEYRYTNPLPLIAPQWGSNQSGTSWRLGNYSYPKIPSGIYEPEMDYNGNFWLERIQFSTDELLDLPDDPSTIVLNHILDFWAKRQAFIDLNITFKRGIILYGPPGSGKSTTIYRLATVLEAQDAIMIVSKSPHMAEKAIATVKKLEPNRKIIIVFEDLDGVIRRYGDESLTQLLDGGSDVNNVLFLATTNYPDSIPARVINRPSRFDVVIEIGMPSEAARRYYIKAMVPNILEDLETLVFATEDLTLAEIKEIIILTQIFDYTITEAVNKLKGKGLKDMVKPSGEVINIEVETPFEITGVEDD